MDTGLRNAPDFALLKGFFDLSSDGMLAFDAHGHLVAANAAARAFDALDVGGALAGRGGAPLDAFAAQLRADGEATAEVTASRADGSGRRLAVEGRRIGERTLVVVRDVSRRHDAEAEAGRLRALAALGEFAADLAHDLNNLLHIVGAASEVLSREVDPSTDAASLVAEIRAAVTHGTAATRDLLARLREAPLSTPQLEVNDVVTGLLPLVARLVGQKVAVVPRLRSPSPKTVVDRGALESALLNLAANARDAMPRGGELTIATSTVTFDDGRDYVALSVADTGEGMTTAVRERAFEPFFTTKPPGHGTGLGLAGVRSFVTRVGGCVGLRSTPGEGTAVVMYLPAA